MRRAGCALLLVGILSAHADANRQQPAAEPDLVARVRAAMATGGVIAGEKTLHDSRALHGSTPDTIDALLWLARGALSTQLFDKANNYAAEGRDLAVTWLRTTRAGDGELQKKLAASLELLALVLVGQGARSDAVHLLRSELEKYRDTAAADGIRNAMRLLSLEEQRAPRLEPGIAIGSRLPSPNQRNGPTLMFFWAHWCSECKAESAMLEKLIDKYRARGLRFIAPTRRYGYTEQGRRTTPDKELQYIVRVRDAFYQFLKRDPVPVSTANYKAYGVSAVPVYVLVDREGIVRLYHPGRMTEVELEAAIVRLLPK